MTKKRQRLAAVQVAVGGEGAGTIVPLAGGTIEELLAGWRVVQVQPLGSAPAAGEAGPAGGPLALLLLEEAAAEESAGRLGFGAT